jgi:predicted molibdopterin-dependent oxidoreductase YjgC
MTPSIEWNGRKVPFAEGETVAQALQRAGVTVFGTVDHGQTLTLVCGIGQCQSCLVEIVGGPTAEACLTRCRDGLALRSIGGAQDD